MAATEPPPHNDEDDRQAREASSNLTAQMGYELVERFPDRIVVKMPVTPLVTNGNGAVQGGLLATLADLAAGHLALPDLDENTFTTTADLTIHYLGAILGGYVRAEARYHHRGRRTIVIGVELFADDSERPAAVATVSFAVLTRRA